MKWRRGAIALAVVAVVGALPFDSANLAGEVRVAHPSTSFGVTLSPSKGQGKRAATPVPALPVSTDIALALPGSEEGERAVRHEVTHAVLDSALAGRPMWVREGAAAYFAGPLKKAGDRPARVRCPSDAELLRPLSAGAQREAYARAEACFARAIADGKQWDQVK